MTAAEPSGRSFGLIALATLVLPGVGALLVIGTLDASAPWLREAGITGALLFCLATALVTGLALVPTNIMSLASGWIFGVLNGTPWVVVGITLGSLLGYAWSSRLAGPSLLNALTTRSRLAAIQRVLLGDDLRTVGTILFLCRLSPLVPFASINLLFGASRVPLPLFVGATILGMTPRAIALVVTGASLAELDFARPGDALSLITGIVATFAAIFVVTRCVKRALRDVINSAT